MRKPLWFAVAMLLLGVGCPSEFGIEGRLDKAMARDTEEMLEERKRCPAGMVWEDPEPSCKNPPCQSGCVAVEAVEDLKQCPTGMHWEEPKEPCTSPPCKPGCVADVVDH